MSSEISSSGADDARTIDEQIAVAAHALMSGQPLSLDFFGTGKVTEHVRCLAVRTLKSGLAGPELQLRLANALECASQADVRRSLSIKASKPKDWKKRIPTVEAYFWEMEQSGGECDALLAAYDVHFGADSFDRDKLAIDCEERNKWKYKDTQVSVASVRLAEVLIPLLKEEGINLSGTAIILRYLGLP